MRRLTCVAACWAATLLVTLPTRAHGQFHWQGHLAAGKRLEIKGGNGDIEAGPAAGDQVDVTATQHARESDTGSVEVRVRPFQGRVALCAGYPTPRPPPQSHRRPA